MGLSALPRQYNNGFLMKLAGGLGLAVPVTLKGVYVDIYGLVPPSFSLLPKQMSIILF